MFELSVALKYLTPRWRQLSVSIISLISILVISLVVWLIVVFFSVTNGLEKSWIQKLIAMTAPVRVTPTPAYYRSYYYQVDSIASGSDYTLKTIGEKLKAKKADPYNPDADEEVPSNWSKPDLDPSGKLKDLASLAVSTINSTPGLKARDFELTASNLKLRLLRRMHEGRPFANKGEPQQSQAFLSQAVYLGSLDPENHSLSHSIVKLTMTDLNNILDMTSVAADNIQQDAPDSILTLETTRVQQHLKDFFDHVAVHTLKTGRSGWFIPKTLYPQSGQLEAVLVKKGDRPLRLFAPKNDQEADAFVQEWSSSTTEAAKTLISFDKGALLHEGKPLPATLGLEVGSDLSMNATVDKDSIAKATTANGILFHVSLKLQNSEFAGAVPYRYLHIGTATIKSYSPFWFSQKDNLLSLPVSPVAGEGVLLPKAFREAGVLVGDRGYLSYYTPTASAVQEQRAPFFVAGFYDPGIIPLGGKFLVANGTLTSLIRSAHNQEDTTLSNGINVRLDDISQTAEVKEKLQKAFYEAGIAPYWKIETYREYDFTKDLIQQLRSDKVLFTLISTVIIIVACSNIITMLIILVNDKKLEIGILRSMGASSASIATIFGICGIVMGVAGSLIGILLALITLRNLDKLVEFLSAIQGHNAFNPIFFGDTLPNQVSMEALLFVILATGLISLIAGVVPAVKACLMKPSTILRAE